MIKINRKAFIEHYFGDSANRSLVIHMTKMADEILDVYLSEVDTTYVDDIAIHYSDADTEAAMHEMIKVVELLLYELGLFKTLESFRQQRKLHYEEKI